jgi:hypothetical protein
LKAPVQSLGSFVIAGLDQASPAISLGTAESLARARIKLRECPVERQRGRATCERAGGIRRSRDMSEGTLPRD